MILGILFCLLGLIWVAITVICAAFIYEVWDFDFISGAICFFLACLGLSTFTFGVLMFIQGVVWTVGY